MEPLPSLPGFDHSLALAREGYRFIGERCRRLGTDGFVTRILLRPTVCLRGQEALELFYGSPALVRQGAAPGAAQATLFGRGGVQGLDGEAHRHRRALFLEQLAPQRVAALVAAFEDHWRAALPAWAAAGRIVLHHASQRVLCAAACDWAGIAVEPGELDRRTAQMVDMIEGAGRFGPGHLRSRRARRAAERWTGAMIERVRRGEWDPPAGCALRAVAEHRDLEGRLLPTGVAAVELLNLLRPATAIARFVTFAALALHEHPAARASLDDGDPAAYERYATEVRRCYPFFPVVAAVVAGDCRFRGQELPRGARVLLDLYATDHDPRRFEASDAFRPERHAGRSAGDPQPVPQGGGDFEHGHRCPGEPATQCILVAALRLLTAGMRYRVVPDQDLRIDLRRIPAAPASGLIIDRVVPTPWPGG